MSDAAKQSVERCKYRHEWKSNVDLGDAGGYRLFTCTKCGFQPKEDSKLWHEADSIVHLRKMLKPGDTVYTVLRHVSRSGMTRGIDCYALSVEHENDCQHGRMFPDARCTCTPKAKQTWITSYVGHAIGSPQPRDYWQKSLGLKVGGCGMDMGFAVVNDLNYVLYPTYQCIGDKCQAAEHYNEHTPKDGTAMHKGGYALKHEWL